MPTSAPTRARRGLLAALCLAALCLTVALVIAPKPAQASASGCTGLDGWPLSHICIFVSGSGLNVDEARTTFATPGRPCNTELRISFFDTNNNMYAQYKQGLKTGCRVGDTYAIKPNKDFRTGRVCGSVVISGSAKPGACVNIFR